MKAIPKRTLLVTCIIILLPMFFGLALWNRLPERMPTHFDFSGEVDGYSGRPFAVIGLPLFILRHAALLRRHAARRSQKAEHFRKAGTAYPVDLPRRQPFCRHIHVFERAGLRHQRLGMVFVGLIFIVIGNYLPKCRHNYTVGIRLPWTLDNEDNWNHTHRFAGYVWIIAGVVTLLSVFLSHAAVVWVAAIFVASLSPLVYSFVYAKRHGKI